MLEAVEASEADAYERCKWLHEISNAVEYAPPIRTASKQVASRPCIKYVPGGSCEIGSCGADASEAGTRLLQMVLDIGVWLAALMPLASAHLHPRVVVAEGSSLDEALTGLADPCGFSSAWESP